MIAVDPVTLNLAVALGIGLLIGAERERRKGEGPSRSPAGIRTFTITSLAGAISFIVGGQVLLAIAIAGVIILTAAAYWRGREDDPGLTTEIALIVTALLGGLSTNTISKFVLAGITGGRAFALRVIPGLIVVTLAAWVGAVAIGVGAIFGTVD